LDSILLHEIEMRNSIHLVNKKKSKQKKEFQNRS
jgi:hypothetical protein